MLTSIRAYASSKIRKIVKGEEGAALVEYALLVGLIAVVCVTIITTLGTTIQGKFQAIVTALGS